VVAIDKTVKRQKSDTTQLRRKKPGMLKLPSDPAYGFVDAFISWIRRSI
jgi:hypothetical protein